MKKVILAALSVVALTATASAADLELKHITTVPEGLVMQKIENYGAHETTAPRSRAEVLTIDYSPAYEPYGAYGLEDANAGDVYAQAFQFNGSKIMEFAGNDITAINFYVGGNQQSGVNQVRSYTVFLTHDLEEEPFYTQDFLTTASKPYTYCTVPLKTPYTIEEGTTLYAGIKYKLTSGNDITLIADGIYHGSDYSGSWFGIEQGGKMQWDNFADQIGFFCLGATITGENLPTNRISVVALNVEPVIIEGNKFDFQVMLQNDGANDVKNIEIQYTIGDQPTVTETFENPSPMPYNQRMILTAPDCTYDKASADDVPITFTVTKVNGVENKGYPRTGTITFLMLPEGKGYTRQVVIEEITGTWCGWCPTGYSVMEMIRNNFPEGGLIPVCIHVNSAGALDPMYTSAFSQVAELGSGGVPDALLSRREDISPQDYDEVIAAYEELIAVPALGKVDVEFAAVPDQSKTIKITAKTEYVFDLTDAADRYILAFAVTEDEVGPYNQNNYYSGEKGDYYGWENKPSSVPTIYNDVARQLSRFSGIPGSVPQSVTAGESYEFEYELKLTSKIKDLDHINVVAYLLDRRTGFVENAAVVKSKYFQSVSDIEIDNNENAPVEYFNLQGIRVNNPENGIYIRRQGTEVSKVYVGR